MKRCSLCLCLASLGLVATGCRQATDLGPMPQLAASQSIRAALGSEAPSGSDATVQDLGEGWATLKGRFLFAGDPPKMPPYAADKDLANCAPGGSAPPQEYLLVDPSSNGLANVAVFLRKAPRVHESAAPSDQTIVFDQKVCVFLTHVMAVSVGQPMELKNSDDVGHNTNISGQNSFNQTIPAGASVAYTPQREEAAPAPVRCSIHPWMLAYLLPRENQYVAVSGPDGTFEIPNLPAGTELEMQVWHESSSGPNGAVVASGSEADALKWSKKGRFTIRLAADEVREIDIPLTAAAFVSR